MFQKSKAEPKATPPSAFVVTPQLQEALAKIRTAAEAPEKIRKQVAANAAQIGRAKAEIAGFKKRLVESADESGTSAGDKNTVRKLNEARDRLEILESRAEALQAKLAAAKRELPELAQAAQGAFSQWSHDAVRVAVARYEQAAAVFKIEAGIMLAAAEALGQNRTADTLHGLRVDNPLAGFAGRPLINFSRDFEKQTDETSATYRVPCWSGIPEAKQLHDELSPIRLELARLAQAAESERFASESPVEIQLAS